MKLQYFIPILFIVLCSKAAAQPTRYWQQRVDTRIEVRLDDKRHFLHAFIEMDYYNNSPDTLHFIYFHVYPNAYSNDRTAYNRQSVENRNTRFYFSKEAEKGFIDSLNFTVSSALATEEKANIVYTRNDDVIKVMLPEPLAPGAKITLNTPFRVKIPKCFSRMGYQKDAYQISQWFPKPAVYDAKGWHAMPYLDQGEFYSEFGSYDVSITLPKRYVVMATGNLTTEFENDWLDSLAALPAPIIDTIKLTKVEPNTAAESSHQSVDENNLKTLRFKEDNIHDFAWFANANWVVRKDTIFIPEANHTVTAYSCYTPKSQKGWQSSIEAVKKAIRGYSAAVGAYPYSTVKVVEGDLSAGGGMEYPTVTVISPSSDTNTISTTIVHEVGHNWFYGILGSNERDHPWMDESLNSFYEIRIAPTPNFLGKFSKVNDMYLMYAALGAMHKLMPGNAAAIDFPDVNYGIDVYGKMAYYIKWLEAYMGKDTFEMAMKNYYKTWQYKHPQPEDFSAVFQQHTTKNLDWFFNEAMAQSRGVDFAIGKVTSSGVKVKNKTGLKVPVQIFYSNGTDSGSVWSEPFTGTKVLPLPAGKYNIVKVADAVPDYNFTNNAKRTPFSVRSFGGLNTESKTKTWIAPAIGYNHYNGFMAGLLWHNITIPSNKFQFALAPMYAFGSKNLAGTGFVSYSQYLNQGFLHSIDYLIEAKSFALGKSNFNIDHYLHTRFVKVAPEVVFNFRKPYYRSNVERSLSVKAYWIREGSFDYQQDSTDLKYKPAIGKNFDNFYAKATYNYRNKSTFNPFAYKFEGQVGQQFAKLSAEFNARVDYHQKNKSLYVRAYLGKFFDLGDNIYDAYRYRLATTHSGWNDYLYDETYGGRNVQQGFWSQQIAMREGGFKINTLQYSNQLGLSDNMLFALNLKSDLPYTRLPIRVYADIATFSGAKRANPSAAALVYSAGLEVYISNYVSVYLPLLNSKDYAEYTKSVYPMHRFLRSIAFTINLDNLRWHRLPEQVLQ